MNAQRISTRALSLTIAFTASISAQQVSDPAPALLLQLQSRETTDKAREALLKKADTDADVRAYLARNLPAIIQNSSRFTQSCFNAVRLAGELKTAEAAPALARWIGVDNVGGEITAGSWRRLESVPAGKALAQIGDPAIPSLANVLERGTARERVYAYLALNLIASERAMTALHNRLEREDNQVIRKEIEDVTKMSHPRTVQE